MRVLVAHNRYVSTVPSGENLAVDADVEGLLAAGVEVIPYIRSSDEIAGFTRRARAGLVIRPFWSASDAHAVQELIERYRPDVVHVHNVNPLLSPAVIRVAQRAGVPVIHTVHNYRRVCASGTFTREGSPCRECVGHAWSLPAIRHACYRDSRAQSAVIAASERLHRATWREVDLFVAPSTSMADYLQEDVGIPSRHIRIRPHGVPDPGPITEPGAGVVFVGRLTDEKGVRLLLDAWRRHPPELLGPLTIIGAGPEEASVRAAVKERSDILYVGTLAPSDVSRHISAAAAVVVPSTCAEAFGRVAVEGLAHGRPVVATALGGLVDIVSDDVGALVEPDAAALGEALWQLLNGARLAEKARAARQRYLARYTPAAASRSLIQLYDEACGNAQSPRG